MSNTKKIGRRRHKKQLMDQEDLQNQQNLQQMNKNSLQTDLFQAAKLQQNYFIRTENNKNKNKFKKNINLDDDDDQDQINLNNTVQNKNKNHFEINHLKQDQKNNQLQQKNNQEIKIKNTDKKRRKKPLKTKKQSIFDDDDQQENQEQNQKIQPQKINQTNTIAQQKVYKKNHIQKQRKQKSSSQNSDKSQQQPDSLVINNIKTNDQFDNIIKDQQDQKSQSEQQKIIHLHQLFNNFTKQQRKAYFYQPLKQGEVALGYFKRISSGISQIYQFLGQDHRPVLFCENQRGCIGCNYYISLTKQMDKNKSSYLGKLRGNATGSLYNLYDCGVQPKKQMNRSEWRVSLAAIQYQSNFMGFNGPRKLKVTVPSPKHFQDPDNFKLSEEESILNFKPPVIAQFRNKTPKWNQKLKSYALNFGGRVKLASIKNFILINNEYAIEQEDQADNVIIFGKIDQTTFSIQYRYPLSLFQAFGIIMSQFDFKLNCQ